MKSFYFISLRDLFKDVKREKRRFLFLFFFFFILYFFYGLFKPILYTAQAIFKTPPPTSLMWMDFFTKERESVPHEDPRLLLNSYPVTSKVVKKLHLQGHIKTFEKGFFFHRLWRNLYLERSFAALASQEKPLSEILSSKILVPRHSLDFFEKPSLIFKDLSYEGEFQRQLTLHFIDKEHYLVFDAKKKKLGVGKIDQNFSFPEGHFTLSGCCLTKKAEIVLIPLKSAALSLSEQLLVKKIPKKPALLLISWTSPNLDLSINIVNSIMEAYQEFLTEKALETSRAQYLYLKKNQEEALGDLEKTLEKQAQFRQKHIHEGGFLELKEEAAFVMKKKQELSNALLEIKMTMLRLSDQVFQKSYLSFETLLDEIKKLPFDSATPLSIQSLQELLQNYLNEWDGHELEKKHIDESLSSLQNSACDLATLVKTFEESSCQSIALDIQKLNEKLNDKHNWSGKENEIFLQQLATQKSLLEKELHRLSEACQMKISLWQNKIYNLECALLKNLASEYDKIEQTICALSQKELTFPERWIQEEQITLKIKLTIAMIEQISKVMEIKNIAAKLNSTESYPLEKAMKPILPHPPFIFQKSLLTALFSVLLYFFWLFYKHMQTGPRATLSNLKALKSFVVEADLYPGDHFFSCDVLNQKALKEISWQLGSASCILLSSQIPLGLWQSLIDLMRFKDERMVVLHLQEGQIEGIDNFTFNYEKNIEEEIFSSKRFINCLAELKQTYDRVFVIYHGENTSLLQKFVSQTVLFISTEMLKDLPDALYVTERKKNIKESSFKSLKEKINALQNRIFSEKQSKL